VILLLVVIGVAVGAYVLTSDDDDGGPTAAPPGGGSEEPAGGGSEGPTATEAVGPATQPPTGVPELDQYAQGCHDGSMSDCDSLYIEAFDIQFENDAAVIYTIYSQSCGGRLVNTASTQACTERIAD
jgi:hypothetical protein